MYQQADFLKGTGRRMRKYELKTSIEAVEKSDLIKG